MTRPCFQFRLWTIFAITALVGWGIVALPYWLDTYPEEQRIQDDLDESLGIVNLPPSEREKEGRLRDRQLANQGGWGEPTPPKRYDLGVKVLFMGGASIAALLIGLASYRFYRRKAH